MPASAMIWLSSSPVSRKFSGRTVLEAHRAPKKTTGKAAEAGSMTPTLGQSVWALTIPRMAAALAVSRR